MPTQNYPSILLWLGHNKRFHKTGLHTLFILILKWCCFIVLSGASFIISHRLHSLLCFNKRPFTTLFSLASHSIPSVPPVNQLDFYHYARGITSKDLEKQISAATRKRVAITIRKEVVQIPPERNRNII